MMYNTFGLRVAAVLIDNALLLPLALMGGSGQKRTVDIVVVLVLLLEHTYFIIGHAQYGQTIGKRLLGVKVVRTHEHLPIGWWQAIQRELMWIALSLAYVFVFTDRTDVMALVPGAVLVAADATLAAIHPQNRSLRDFIARTVVIRFKPVGKE